MPFSDGSSGVIEKVLIPFDDLNLKEGTVGFLRTPEDVAVHLSVLSAQGPQGARLLRATDQGLLRVNAGRKVDKIIPFIPPATYSLPYTGPVFNGPYGDTFISYWGTTAINGTDGRFEMHMEISFDGGLNWVFYMRLGLGTGIHAQVDTNTDSPIPPLFRPTMQANGDATALTGFMYLGVVS